MAKVLVGRPRSGAGYGGKGYRKELQRTPIEDQPTREGIKARSRGGSKWFGDHLSPVERFLRTNAGRPWDKVFSEICAELRKGFPVREHFLRHVRDLVVVHTVLIDGVACGGEGREYGVPISELRWRRFYVCPKTRLLRVNRR